MAAVFLSTKPPSLDHLVGGQGALNGLVACWYDWRHRASSWHCLAALAWHATCGASAADACDLFTAVRRAVPVALGRISAGPERSRIYRGAECDDRVPLGARSIRAAAGDGRRSGEPPRERARRGGRRGARGQARYIEHPDRVLG